jgi:SpoIID/LytB domain protein
MSKLSQSAALNAANAMSTPPSLFNYPKQLGHWVGVAVAVTCAVGLTAKPGTAQNFPEPNLDVGIVQRFGTNPTDKITVAPQPGDRLTLEFQTGEQKQTVNTTGSVKIEVSTQPLPEPQVVERVVLSTHRSFESAEDSADQWRSHGIEVEIAQPRQWQVWAKRGTYHTPLLRRLLMQNLQAHGSNTAFLDSQIQRQIPKAAFTVNGFRYQRDELNISSGNRRVYVTLNDDTSTRSLYAGTLRLQTNAYGNYTLVNQVPLETYLRGVVPHEIGVGAPRTTIEAQAILARTYALRNLRRFAIDNYQLCADTQCQVYEGLSGAAEVTDQAIAATQGKVLTYRNELVDALYSSTTGGVTAPFSDVWNGPDRPYLRAVVDSVQNVWDLSRYSLSDERSFRNFISQTEGFNEDGWDMFRWRVESTLPEIAADLRKYLQSKQHPLADFNQITGLEVTERSPAGRVRQVKIQTDVGVVTLEKDEILRALYAPNSTLFYVDPIYEELPQPPTLDTQPPSPDPQALNPAQASGSNAQSPLNPAPARVLKGYVFVGGGLGHGVGMSQTGAYHLGDLNWTSDRILSFYYPGTQVVPLSSNIVFWRDPNL